MAIFRAMSDNQIQWLNTGEAFAIVGEGNGARHRGGNDPEASATDWMSAERLQRQMHNEAVLGGILVTRALPSQINVTGRK